ncbi:MAG: comR [Planctomycetota bacterium]|nr:comR [Planctomycetota bacterium]
MPIGRPRAFDIDVALDRALEVFWRKGYEGATLPDLTRAMGINRPSLYAAFGNKEALFRKAIERYLEGPACHVQDALSEPTARAVVDRLLRGSIELITDPENPRGCFMVQSALACGDTADCLRRELIKRRALGEAALRERFERAIADGDLPAESNTTDLARYVMTLSHGMAVQAAGGATRDDLTTVASMAMQAWPS